jgi:hypothetical protein
MVHQITRLGTREIGVVPRLSYVLTHVYLSAEFLRSLALLFLRFGALQNAPSSQAAASDDRLAEEAQEDFTYQKKCRPRPGLRLNCRWSPRSKH